MNPRDTLLEHLASIRGYVDDGEARRFGGNPTELAVVERKPSERGAFPREFQEALEAYDPNSPCEPQFDTLERLELRLLLQLGGAPEPKSDLDTDEAEDEDEPELSLSPEPFDAEEDPNPLKAMSWLQQMRAEADDPIRASDAVVDAWRASAKSNGAGRRARAPLVAAALVDCRTDWLPEYLAFDVAQCRTLTIRTRAQLIEQNLRLALFHAYRRRYLDFPWALGASITGLIRAVDGFEPLRGFRFSTYAHWWLKQAVTRAANDHGRSIRHPVHATDKLTRIRALLSDLSPTQQFSLKLEDIATLCEIGIEDAAKVQALANSVVKSDAPSIHARGVPLDELYDSERQEPAEVSSGFEREGRLPKLRDRLTGAVNYLGTSDAWDATRTREILHRRLGLGKAHSETLKEIGESFDVSRERIRQLQEDAFERLRKQMTANRRKE